MFGKVSSQRHKGGVESVNTNQPLVASVKTTSAETTAHDQNEEINNQQLDAGGQDKPLANTGGCGCILL